MTTSDTAVASPAPRCLISDADDDEAELATLIAAEAGLVHARDIGSATRRIHGRHVRVARRSGAVVGFAQLSVTGCSVAVLDFVYVHHGARRSGTGAALCADISAVAAALGIDRVAVVAHPAAEIFFRRVGALRTGTACATDVTPWVRPRFEIERADDAGRRSVV